MRAQQAAFRILAAVIGLLPVSAAECCRDSVAMVESLTGQASLQAPNSPARVPVARLEWLKAGANIEVGTKSTITVILLNGHRYELGAGAKATITGEALTNTRGSIRELKTLPPLPALAPIADNSAATSAAVRMRGLDTVRNLYPREGMSALADSVTLSFSSAPDASRYQVDITNQLGERIARYPTEATSVKIPAGTLRAGSLYTWRVRAIGSVGLVAQGAASFTTISEQDLARRTEFASALHELAPGAPAAALLGDLDLRLGLLHEAQQELEAALRLMPDDPAIQRALELVRAAVSEAPR
jgi:hypothetical protein